LKRLANSCPTLAGVGGQARQPLRRPPEESGPPVYRCEPTLQSPRLTYRHPYHRWSELQTHAERFIEEVPGDDPEAVKLRIEERELEADGMN